MKNISIRSKLLTLCIVLVVLTAIGISVAYYTLTIQNTQREFRQRIQIAFDFILDNFTEQLHEYTSRIEKVLNNDIALYWAAYLYQQDNSRMSSRGFVSSYLKRAADKVKELGSVILLDRVHVYGADRRLLLAYQRLDDQETVGGYVISETGNDAYLSLDDSSQLSSDMISNLPDNPLPPGIMALYEGEFPETIVAGLFREGGKIGLKIVAPVRDDKETVGVFVSEVFYTQATLERYAFLSKTDINLFADNQLSFGTLLAQSQLDPGAIDRILSCDELMKGEHDITISSVIFNGQSYYQGQCALRDAQAAIGAITISLSKRIERQEIKKILKSVLIISIIMISIATALLLLFSRTTIRSIHDIVGIIAAAAEGDLRRTAVDVTHDEIGMLATKLNQMITQLRTISTEVQGAAHAVNTTADTIFEQMDGLIGHMEHQSSSVDNTTLSVEKITEFINVVAQNTTELLVAAAQILASIQQTRASIEEVTTSTGSLTTNLHLISSSVEQANQTVKQISESTGELEQIAQQTATEVQHINQVLGDVSQNADQTRQLAGETMEAATRGHSSVEASIQGMADLKTVVSDTARIIREVSSWGEQVSSILNIVDEITEQTALLSLNASIISAQAGEHGRGFAVVADEIKELATRTKTSTKEIGTLVYELQKKTEEGVNNTVKGIQKADQGVQLANAVQEALTTILERATRSSTRAVDTAQAIQAATDSSQTIRTSMQHVTERVSQIRAATQGQESDMEQVVLAVENISGMAEEVNRSSIEQTKTAEHIARSMENVTDKFSNISEQTEELKQNSQQVVSAMHTIESTTDQILRNANDISGDTVKSLVQQSDVLQHIVKIFKVSSS